MQSSSPLVNTQSCIRGADDALTTSAYVFISDNQVLMTSASSSFGIKVTAGSGPGSSVNAAVINNSVNTATLGAFPTSGAFFTSSTGTSKVCLTLNNNTAINPPSTTAFGFSTADTGMINIESIGENIGGPISTLSTAGNGTYFVAPDSCGN